MPTAFWWIIGQLQWTIWQYVDTNYPIGTVIISAIKYYILIQYKRVYKCSNVIINLKKLT